MTFPGSPLAPRLCERDGERVEAVASGLLFGKSIEVRAVVPADVGERLQIRVYQGEQRVTLALVDGDRVVASTVTTLT